MHFMENIMRTCLAIGMWLPDVLHLTKNTHDEMSRDQVKVKCKEPHMTMKIEEKKIKSI